MHAGFQFLRPLAAPLAALALVVATAHAQTWNETGDAGQTIATAQHTTGSGPLQTIQGSLASASDVDVYCIQLGAVPPQNLAIVALQCVVTGGPNVWLFDAAGNGVFSSWTCQFSSKNILAPGSGLSAGTYYVAVSYSGMDPQSAGGALWTSALGQRAPDGPGAGGPLTGWAGTGNVQPSNPYTIQLAFMNFCDAPTPVLGSTWGRLKSYYRD